ncbi:PREDICTED: conserved oligomeric Golgi complex subunit 6-like, partial [Cariama cristata]|uniref:conserved oligomeric Golgi complex subunit 6-like n=1 Tax=Cariama cristata TaxID=54380 RepID=UPI00052016B6
MSRQELRAPIGSETAKLFLSYPQFRCGGAGLYCVARGALLAASSDRLRNCEAIPVIPSVPLRRRKLTFAALIKNKIHFCISSDMPRSCSISLNRRQEMLEALKALSTFFVENSLRTRRNLRGDIERRSLAINEEFVHIFKQVKEELESINEDVQAMSSCCEDMSSRLKAAKEQTQDLIVKTTKLQAE